MPDLLALRHHLEIFLVSHPKAMLRDPYLGLVKMEEWHYSCEVEHQRLILTLWNSEQSCVRRIEGVGVQENDYWVMKVSLGRAAGFEMELDGRSSLEALREKRIARNRFPVRMRSLLQTYFPDIRVERLLTGKDLSRSLSEHYCRGWGSDRMGAWVLFGVNASEDQPIVDSALSFGLIWLDQLRHSIGGLHFRGMKILIPVGRGSTLATRLAYLRAEGIELLEYDEEEAKLVSMDPADYGNLDTRLSRVNRVPLPPDRIPIGALPEPIQSSLPSLEIIHRPSSGLFSIRCRGLEFARLAEERSPQLTFGVGGLETPYEDKHRDELARLIDDLQRWRRADSSNPEHPYYRLQAERWLESLVVSDIRRIHFDLDPDYIYPQVPAFSGLDRGVIDILSLTREGRLAVVELKVVEDINLPLQALDYWTRVKWHHERGDFERQGYFPGREVAPQSPLLILVCPAFRYHSTTESIVRRFPRSIEVVKVGLNEDWRRGVQVLFRRYLR